MRALALLLLLVLTPAAVRAAERVVLPTDVAPRHYDLEVTPDIAGLTFTGRVGIDLDVRRPTREVTLNAVELTLDRAEIAGAGAASVSYDAARQTATLRFPRAVPAGARRLTIAYHGPINTSSSGFFAVDWTAGGAKKRLIATKFEPAAARRFLPVWDEPALKATYTVTATVPQGLVALSNTPVAEERALGGGLKQVRFQRTPKMSSYLLFFGAGDFGRLSRTVGPAQVSVVARREAVAQGDWALKAATEVLPFFNAYFGAAYPLPKLDLIAAPGSGSFGAMENWGAIFFFDNRLLIDPATAGEADRRGVWSTTAHEIAHQWFGDLVTMRWWDDLWLNEGFATWMEGKAAARFHPEWDAPLQAAIDREAAINLDAGAATHPVVTEVRDAAEANSAFDRITYDKGQAVIGMLEAFVGPDAFRAGVRRYFARHAYGNTVTDDLWREVEAASGKPVRAVARAFTDQPGVPLLRAETTADGKLRLTPGRFVMGPPAAGPQPKWAVPGVIGAPGAKGSAVLVEGPQEVAAPAGGPAIVNAGQAGYLRVAYADRDFDALLARFGALAPVDQYGLLSDAWALGRAGAAPLERVLRIIDRLPADASPLLTERAVGIVAQLDGLYDGLPGQPAFRAWAYRVLRPRLARLDWEARAGEPSDAGLLRESLLLTLAQMNDMGVVFEANRRFDAFRKEPATLPAGLRGPVLAIAGETADRISFGQLRKLARETDDPGRKRQFLLALAGVRDPELAREALALSLTPETPGSVQASLIVTVAARHPDLAWRFIQDNAAAIAPNLDLRRRFQLAPDVARRSGSAARAAELTAYARANFPEGARRFADQAAADIVFRAEVRERRLPELDRALAGRRGQAAASAPSRSPAIGAVTDQRTPPGA